MKNYKLRGSAAVVVLTVLLVVAVGVIIYMILGNGKGLGKGDGEGNSNAETAPSQAVTEVVTSSVSETSVSIVEIEYIEVTVRGNDYICNNNAVSLDELIDMIRSDENSTPVRIRDSEASKKAYDNLVARLNENGILFTDAEG